MPMRPRSGSALGGAPEKVVLEFLAARRLEGVNLAALRIDAGHDVLDDAVFAGGIHALQHHEHGPAAVRVKPLLHVGEPADAVGEDRPHLIDIGREAECLRGIVIGEPEMLAACRSGRL